MDTYECIATKFDVREFDSRPVPSDIKIKVLEAARMTGTGLNTQHWRFVLIDDKDTISQLAADSTSGMWVSGANFAIVVLTNPKHRFHALDAGRVVQDMQLAAWNFGVASGIYTGVNEPKLRKDFKIPDELFPTVIVGFGYPKGTSTGKAKKNRLPLSELVYSARYGNRFQP